MSEEDYSKDPRWSANVLIFRRRTCTRRSWLALVLLGSGMTLLFMWFINDTHPLMFLKYHTCLNAPLPGCTSIRRGGEVTKDPAFTLCEHDTWFFDNGKLRDANCTGREDKSHRPHDSDVHQPVFTPDTGTEFTNLLELHCPPYLPEFRAPCWKEAVETETPYTDNPFKQLFIEGKNLTAKFSVLSNLWSNRWKDGQRWRLRCLPYFFIVGVHKCGTTDLFVRLNFHNDIREPYVKEPQWFDATRFTNVGYMTEAASINDYIDLFDMVAVEIWGNKVKDECGRFYHPAVSGDASTWTFTRNRFWRNLPENQGSRESPRYLKAHYIRHLIPQAKIIVMFRQPAERLYSAYLFFDLGDKNPEAFHTWATWAVTVMTTCLKSKPLRACMYDGDEAVVNHLGGGMYYAFLRDWLAVFPREQIHIIHFETDYREDHLKAVEDSVEFLGLRPLNEDERRAVIETAMHNSRRGENADAGAMLDSTRQLLDNFYRPFNEKLAELLKDRRYLWET